MRGFCEVFIYLAKEGDLLGDILDGGVSLGILDQCVSVVTHDLSCDL